MGKPTGFMEYERELPADRPQEERVGDWQEFHLKLPQEKLRQQGARCMDCGTPFCHTGVLLSGMASGCPVNNLIPEWNDLVYRNLWRQALNRLHRTNNFPEFTGRVCPAPCEGSCVLGFNEPPVTIKQIEVAIAERGWEEGWIVPEPPETRTGKEVAVVGSGPAGLSAAAQLNRAGHSVTVFERSDRPGGILMYGIPNMKLDKEAVVLRRIRQMEAEGVRFSCNSEIGGNYPAEKLRSDFDAVVLATGAGRPRDLRIEGRELDGIHFAMDFLCANTKALLDRSGVVINAQDLDVVIIGGGDTGTDCVATSLRHRCRSVTQLEILPKPPLARAATNPWPEWPQVYSMDYGQEEAAQLFGSDPRSYATSAVSFQADDAGSVRSVRTVEVGWEVNHAGMRIPKEIPGTEQEHPAQLVLLALGFLGPEQPLLEELGVERNPNSTVTAEYEQYQTSIPGVFAAGDCRRGQSLVVWAFNEGRGAARECDRYLMGETDLP
jgi:glutamate synthase (NADPH/NADH) small chain